MRSKILSKLIILQAVCRLVITKIKIHSSCEIDYLVVFGRNSSLQAVCDTPINCVRTGRYIYYVRSFWLLEISFLSGCYVISGSFMLLVLTLTLTLSHMTNEKKIYL